MSRARLKLILGGLTVAASLTYLGAAGLRGGLVYYVDVDQFVERPPPAGAHTRIHGTVAAEHLNIRPADLVASFEIRGAAHTVPVEYRGVIPEQFAAGREVVVEGRIDDAGVFHADVLLTKCASKYEGQPHPAANPESRP